MRHHNTSPTLTPSLVHERSGKMTRIGRLCSSLVVILVSGCASYGLIDNEPMQEADYRGYSVAAFMEKWRTDENALMLAFSGGGTRAAALSYGVQKGPLGEEPEMSNIEDTRVCVSKVSTSQEAKNDPKARQRIPKGVGANRSIQELLQTPQSNVALP